jgi:hypothetical protein
MPRLARWADFPRAIQQHLLDRLDDRSIGMADLASSHRAIFSSGVLTDMLEWNYGE